jgi:hypothetical protein
MVFLHGGRMRTHHVCHTLLFLYVRPGFQIPGPHSPFYNGQYLSDIEDVVFDTVK